MADPETPPAISNRLLAALAPETLTRLLPNLHTVSLPLRKTLESPGGPIETVYFVERGIISVVVNHKDGAQSEVGIVGREGMIGAPLAVGVGTCFAETYVQVEASALAMGAGEF